jgi:hypothetical protein
MKKSMVVSDASETNRAKNLVRGRLALKPAANSSCASMAMPLHPSAVSRK